MPTDSQQNQTSNSLPEYPATILDFHRMFPDEAACLQYLEECVGQMDFPAKNVLTLTIHLDFRLIQGSSVESVTAMVRPDRDKIGSE